MQIKTTMRYHYTPVGMVAIKKSPKINAGEVRENGNPLTLLVGMQTSTVAGEQCGDSLKNWK